MQGKNESNQESVSEWIDGMKAGDADATERLWNRYFDRLCRVAEQKMAGASMSVTDKQDLAASAFEALWEGSQTDRFQQLENRDHLWKLLVLITSRKASNQHRQQRTRDETSYDSLSEVLQHKGDQVLDELPMACEDLLLKLDGTHRQVALMRMSAYTNQEIADKLSKSVKSVERYMRNIRSKWLEELD